MVFRCCDEVAGRGEVEPRKWPFLYERENSLWNACAEQSVIMSFAFPGKGGNFRHDVVYIRYRQRHWRQGMPQIQEAASGTLDSPPMASVEAAHAPTWLCKAQTWTTLVHGTATDILYSSCTTRRH